KIRVQLFSTTQASGDGSYRFARVFPDEYRLSGQNSQAKGQLVWFSGPGIPLKIAPGQRLKIDFGPKGHRDVAGRLVLPQSDARVSFVDSHVTLRPKPPERYEIDQNKITTQPVSEDLPSSAQVEKDGT